MRAAEHQGGAFWMVQNSRGGRQSPGLGAGEEQIWRSYQHRRQLLWIYTLDVDDGGRAGSIQIGQNQIGRL